MDSNGYGLLVNEHEDVVKANDANKQDKSNSSQHAESKSNVNDCDTVTCTTNSMPYIPETEEGNFQDKDLQANLNSDEPPLIESRSTSLSVLDQIRRNWILFVVKPVMIFYGLQYAVQGAATTQLWLERSCKVDFNYNDTICKNINDPEWEDYQNNVQQQVTEYSIVGTYINGVPPIIIGLYIGPLSDRSRKLLMYIPFLAHLVSNLVPFFVVYFDSWSPKYLWLTNIYVLGGGYSVLSIAMYGYIGDVTNQKNRTTVMSLLAGLGLIIFPCGIALGGQIYAHSGYYAVYAASFIFNVLGIIYIYFVPESITRSNDGSSEEGTESPIQLSCCQKIGFLIAKGNQTIVESYRCLIKERTNGKRKYLHSLLVISMFAGMAASWNTNNNGLLFTERMFGWELVQYTNFTSFALVIYSFRTFVTTPILCYLFGMHDCMLAIVGGLASVTTYVVTALATKGWMMYYAASLSIIGGLTSTPLQSMLSKVVSKDEFGKIFTLSSVAMNIASLLSSTFLQMLYEATVKTFPGAMYVGLSVMEVITVVLMSIYFIYVIKHEKQFGPIGQNQEERKTE